VSSVAQEQVAGGGGFAHEVGEHAVVHVEVMIDLAAAVVGVWREGVPDAAFGEFGEAHHELAALDAVFVDVLADDALVGGGLRAERHGGGLTGWR
jgi:spermidine synthase